MVQLIIAITLNYYYLKKLLNSWYVVILA